MASPSPRVAVDAARINGVISPGGTKNMDLNITLSSVKDGSSASKKSDEDSWKERLRKEAQAEEALSAAADRALSAAGVDNGGAHDGADGKGTSANADQRKTMKQSSDPAPPVAGGKENFSWDNFDQVQGLSEANASLLLQLDEKDKQIEKLQEALIASKPVQGIDAQKLKDVRMADGTIADQDYRDAKIVDLAKKNRSLNLAVERERSKSSKIASELQMLTEQNGKLEVELSRMKERIKEARKGSPAEEVHKMERATRQAQKKMAELKRRMEKQSSDLKKAHRALLREVGEVDKKGKPIDVQKIVSDGSSSGWRGRSQQIVMLKTKVKRLESEMREAGVGAPSVESSADQMRKKYPRFQSQRGIRGGDADEKAMGAIKRMERSRAEAAEAAMAELEQMRTIAAEQKRKIDGQKARATTLENNNRKMRGEIKVLLKKTTTDDRLIDALREEVAQSRAAVSEMARRLDSVNVSGMSEGEFKKYKGKSESQARQIERQEELITALRAELEQHQSNASTDLVMKAEKDLAIHNKNVDLNLLRVENERLTELSEMFKAKFKSAKANYEGASKKVRELERRAVQLERRLGNINQGGLKRQPPADQFQSLKDRLALQVEENEALKTSFRSALASKDEELRILRTLAEQQQQAYERAVNDVRVQVKKTAGQAQARIIQSQAKNDAQIMEQLAADNDFLRSELRELKAKYREAQAHSKVRPSVARRGK